MLTSRSEFVMPAARVPVVSEPDVCVVGGGAAGVAAAVAAARLNLQVLLVERYGFCGGATVAGLSGTVCGLYSSGDHPEQIVFGFAAEFCDSLRNRGGICGAVPFGRTLLVPHDSFVWKETADALLETSGARVSFHTDFVRAYPGENGAIETLVVRAREGLVAIRPRTIVDASGDAEVVHSAAGSTTLGRDGVVQTPTMVFRMGNVNMGRFLKLDPREIDALVSEAQKTGRYHLPRNHVSVSNAEWLRSAVQHDTHHLPGWLRAGRNFERGHDLC